MNVCPYRPPPAPGEVVAEGLARSKASIQRVIHIDSSQHMLDLAKVSECDCVCVCLRVCLRGIPDFWFVLPRRGRCSPSLQACEGLASLQIVLPA